MKLPFTSADFFRIFREYNLTVYPIQLILIGLSLLAIYSVARRWKSAGKIVPGILSLLWIWMGIAYHWGYFSRINKAAFLFGGLFVIQGLLFLYIGLKKKPVFAMAGGMRTAAALILLLFSLIIYPLWGHFAGHKYPDSPTFGLPCPTTIFTFGMLLLATDRLLFFLFVIPLIWSLIGFSAAFSLGVYEDSGLVVSAAVFTLLMVFGKKKKLLSKTTM